MTPAAELLLERAKAGEVLEAKDRRHVIGYLMANSPELTGVELAAIFKVTDRTIRDDRKYIRETKAKAISEDDISLVVADILIDFERTINDIERSKKKAELGTRTYLDHCNAVMHLRLQTVKSLQDLGYLPKNLGNMTVEKFDYKAIVNKDGSVEVRPVNMFPDDKTTVDAEIVSPDTEAKRAELDAAYGNSKLLPAAQTHVQNTESTTA